MTRHWCINGRFVTQPQTGVQRYATRIVAALDDLMSEGHPLTRDLEIEILVPADAPTMPELCNIPTRVAAGPGGHLWDQLALPRQVRGGLLSLCNSGPIALRRHILCIHDVNTRLYPASYSSAFRALYRVMQPTLGRTACRIATVSDYSATQIAGLGIARRDKITVVPNGHEHARDWVPGHSAQTRGVADHNTIVLIGSLASHKNARLILGLAPALAAHGLRIAVVGMGDDRVFAGLPADNTTGDVTWLGRLSDDELAALLTDSLCLAFPSLEEGFGLPPLEAMALGCPVISSDRASLPEVCGDAALFASPVDPAGWLAQIIRLRGDTRLRAALIEKGRARARLFSWRTSAERYLQLMAGVDRFVAPAPGTHEVADAMG